MLRLKGDIIFELNNIYNNVIFKRKNKNDLKERLYSFLDYVISSSNINSISSIKELHSLILFEKTEPIILSSLFFEKHKEELFLFFNPDWYSVKLINKICPKKYLLNLVFKSEEIKRLSAFNDFYFFQKNSKSLIFNYFFQKEITLKYIKPLLLETEKKEIRLDSELEFTPFIYKKIKAFNCPSSSLSNSFFEKKEQFIVPKTKHYKNINEEIPNSEDFNICKLEFINFLNELKSCSFFNSYSYFFGYSGFKAEELSLKVGQHYLIKDGNFINISMDGNICKLSQHYNDTYSLAYKEKIEKFVFQIDCLINFLREYSI